MDSLPHNFTQYISMAMVFMANTSVAQSPFVECPTEAFLIQNPTQAPIAYGVDVDLGSYRVFDSSMGNNKINAIGYSKHDDFIYGWDYETSSLTLIDAEFIRYPLNVNKIGTTPANIYVGDVSVTENAWYGYRSGYGLYRIDLETLVMENHANSTQFGRPVIYDFAFHPDTPMAYSIDSSGYLIEVDVAAGTSRRMTQVIDTQTINYKLTFGAVYFDRDGNLYASNNSNGYIYKVSLDALSSSAELYAYGPSSNSNDGARCALAPVEPSENTDFGDAPDSYQTRYASSGPRHGVSNLMLGSLVDGETESYDFPLSDDSADGRNDDDGVSFPAPFQVGTTTIIQVTVAGTDADSVLNGWVDWDRDGQFEEQEQILIDRALSDGTHTLQVEIPTWAVSGDTWARFRLGNISGIGPTGGVPYGEVEDYPLEITESGVTTQQYPIGNAFTTFAYEDQYPLEGDYDMNDVLMNVRFTEYQLNNHVIRVKIEGQVAALGGDYHSGFAIRLPNIARDSIKADSVSLLVNNASIDREVLETGTSDAVFIIHQDLWQTTNAGEAQNCTMFRTQANCGTSYRATWQLNFAFHTAPESDQMPDFPYDPFIFASPGYYFGDIAHELTGSYPGRGLEIHLKNNAPTAKFDTRYIALGNDAATGTTHFHNSHGLPWAIEIPSNWKHPLERTTILQAYPQFAQFSQDSQGETATSWYMNPVLNKIYID